MTYDKNRPVSSIKHDDKRAAIPDSAHQGEEQMAISGMPEQSEYDIFCHEFQRGRDPELYWLNKYKNDDEAIYSLDVLLFLFGTSLLFHAQF